MKPVNPPNDRAFTLVEIMIALVIFSMVVAAIYSTWTLILRAARVGQAAAAQVQRQRIALRTLQDSLTCIQSFQASIQYYSFIVQNGDQPVLSFVARLPQDFPRGGRFGGFDVRRLTYTVEPQANGEKDLVLRQCPVLLEMDQDEKEHPLVLARDVQKFSVECWDTNQLQWEDQWDQTNVIPPLVRIHLVVGGNADSSQPDDTVPKMSVTRVVAIPSITVPAIAQSRQGRGAFVPPPRVARRPPKPQ